MATRQTVDLEDYLEAILLVQSEDGVARVSSISNRLGVKMPSVTYALNKLSERGLVKHENYGYVELTEEGQRIAADVYHRHEILTILLHEILGIDKDSATGDACKIEHYLSPETASRLSSLVEFILSGPRSAEWLENYRYFHKHGRRPESCLKRVECKG